VARFEARLDARLWGTVATRTETAASRRRFLRLTAAGAGTLTLGSVLAAGVPALGLSGSAQSRDVEVLNYALLLEELTAAFYQQALARAGLSGELREFAQVAGGHEREHVAALRKALGPKAKKAPGFAFGKAVSTPQRFAATAVALEELAVAAYNGQAANVSKPVLEAAASIVSVDARHAAWIRAIQDKRPASQAVDVARTRRQVLRQVDATGFVRS
jgi:rubrerythrin